MSERTLRSKLSVPDRRKLRDAAEDREKVSAGRLLNHHEHGDDRAQDGEAFDDSVHVFEILDQEPEEEIHSEGIKEKPQSVHKCLHLPIEKNKAQRGGHGPEDDCLIERIESESPSSMIR